MGASIFRPFGLSIRPLLGRWLLCHNALAGSNIARFGLVLRTVPVCFQRLIRLIHTRLLTQLSRILPYFLPQTFKFKVP